MSEQDNLDDDELKTAIAIGAGLLAASDRAIEREIAEQRLREIENDEKN